MKRRLPTARLAAALPFLLLAGCADLMDKTAARTPSHPKAATVVDRSTPRETPRQRERERDRDRDEDAAQARDGAGLREGIRLYNEGDFNGAIRRLSARDVANGPLAMRVMALKYTAFSYCVTSRPTQCRQEFDRALRLDADFDLAPGEHGHPLWGPVFTKAKQGVAR